jgi:hypothetical protein
MIADKLPPDLKEEPSNRIRKAPLLIFSLAIVVFLMPIAESQPAPHDIAGRVFNNASGTGVPNGVIVWAFDNVTKAFSQTQVSAPPSPEFAGSYSLTISGNDNDFVYMASYNATHYGFGNLTLLPTTTFYNLTLNHTRGSEPNVTILTPLDGGLVNTSVVFNVTANVSIAFGNGTDCNATISFSTNAANITQDQNFTNSLGNISYRNHTLTTWNVSGMRDGKLNITVSVRCTSDAYYLYRSNEDSNAVTVIDTTPPTVNLQTPLNNSWLPRNITFWYNVTENTGIRNCSLFIDSKLNQTSYTLPASTSLNFTLNETPEGSHSWFVSCTDNGSRSLEGNSTFRVFTADATPPNITLLFPANNSAMENYTLFFQYNVTDNFNATNCSLIMNGQAVQTNFSISLNISNNFTYTTSGGDYNWSVNCTDNSYTIGASGYFRLLSADLKINASDIIVTTFAPVAKQSIWINATIFNLGSANHTRNATVQFIEHNLYDGINTILANFTVNITSGGNATLNVSYLVHVGDFAIIVEADVPLATNGTVVEANESNNKANITIVVPSYHVFYGDVVADILLATSSSSQVFAWLNATSTAGNIYATDTDSTVSFSTLRPLGRNQSYNRTFDDFAELDLALNTTNLTTSINRTYTADSWANYTRNFTIFNEFITDVPVVNSTNNSNFVTGILWDYSDSTNGNYTGVQDVVFITRINRRATGLYGSYDYELKLPANLERYITPNLQDSVNFYREIT